MLTMDGHYRLILNERNVQIECEEDGEVQFLMDDPESTTSLLRRCLQIENDRLMARKLNCQASELPF